jgi:Eukaryotic protein of unknown function (DUF953)
MSAGEAVASRRRDVDVRETADLERVWDSVISAPDAPATIFLLAVAEKDEEGKYWCPDCTDAAPALEKGLRNALVVTVHVRRSEYRQNPEYPLRKHALTELKAIPQLNRYVRRGEGYELDGSLVENDCKDEEKVEAFVAGWSAAVSLVRETADLERVWEAAISAPDAPATIFLLSVAERAEDGTYWCPDCTEAAPVLHQALKGQRVVEALVRRSEYRQNPEYPLRKHALTQVKAIPQLNRYVRRGEGYELDGTLVENDCKDEAKVRALVSKE